MTTEWRTVPVRDLCLGIFDGPHATPKKTASGPVFLGISSLDGGRLNLEESARLSEDDFPKWTRRVTPQPNDVVFSYETRLGEAAIIPEGLRCCLGRRMALMRPDPSKVDSRFLLYAYLGPEFQETIRERTIHGSTVERILLSEFPGFPMSVPDLATQRAIATLLGALDDKIELNRRTSQTLESIAHAIFKSWFVDFDPVRKKMECGEVGLPPDLAALFPSEFHQTALGAIPSGWTSQALGDVAKVTKGRSYKSTELAASDTALVTLKSFSRMGGYRDDGLKEFTGTYNVDQVVEPGDVLVAHTDVTQAADVLGRAIRVRPSKRHRTLVASLDTAIVRPSTTNLSREFLFFALDSQLFRDHAYGYCNGTTVLHLGARALPVYRLVVPPPDLVAAFSNVATAILDTADVLASENSVLEDTRAGLLPKLVAGRLRVMEVSESVKGAGV